MMQQLLNFFLNRNFILVFAVIMGLILGDHAKYISGYGIYVLGITMVFASTGIDTRALWPVKKLIGPMLAGTFLNYFVFGSVVLLFAWLLIPDRELFLGFVVIVAAPPGVAVIPFTGILKGKVEYAIVGVFGAFIASIVIAPVLIGFFVRGGHISSWDMFVLMIKLVLIPLVISRFLIIKKIFPYVEKIRGKAVDWGFAVLIFIAVGTNRSVFFSHPNILLICLTVLLVSTFGLGFAYEFYAKKANTPPIKAVPNILLLTIKSSGFSVVTAFRLFGQKAAIPSAILAVVVLIFLLVLSLRNEIKTRKELN